MGDLNILNTRPVAAPRRRRVAAAALSAAAAVALAACSFSPFAETVEFAQGDLRARPITAPSAPPELVATDVAQAQEIARGVGQTRLDELAARRGTETPAAAQVPYLYGSSLGRAYLAGAGRRALAFGHPAATCPASGAASEAATPQAAAETALRRCLEATNQSSGPLRGGDECGCRLAVVDDVLLVAREDLGYAQAVSATVRFDDGARATLIAEDVERPTPTLPETATADAAFEALDYGARTLRLSSAAGPVGTLTLNADGSASLTLDAGGAAYEGNWASDGRRRGWLARRVALERGERSIVVLIGYEPGEIAERGAELFAAE